MTSRLRNRMVPLHHTLLESSRQVCGVVEVVSKVDVGGGIEGDNGSQLSTVDVVMRFWKMCECVRLCDDQARTVHHRDAACHVW